MFNGVIHSTILDGEEIILEENDRIAAFVNSVCRGTTETFMAPDDPDLPFQDIFELQVYGNTPITLVTSFSASETRIAESNNLKILSDRDVDQFNIYRNNQLVAESITDLYFIDNDTEYGEEYCYQVMLLDPINNEEYESMEQCISINFLLGDLNQDGTINVLDIVGLVDIILNDPNPSEANVLFGDITQDGELNVLDIVALVQIILGDSLARDNHPTREASFLFGNGIVSYKSDGELAGIQLEVIGDFEITDNHLPDGWEIAFSEETIIMYSLDGSNLTEKILFEYTGDLTIESAIAADWYGNEIMVSNMLLPKEFTLSPAYPNPFNPTTTLTFSLPVDTEVSLSIYNLQGREVSTLISGYRDAGYHSVVWDANSHSSGVYFVKMVAGEYVNTQKLMLVK